MYVFQEAYFVCTLLRSGRVYFDQSKIVDFPTSTMGRHLLAVSAHCGQVRIRLDQVPVILSVSRIRIRFYFQFDDLNFKEPKFFTAKFRTFNFYAFIVALKTPEEAFCTF